METKDKISFYLALFGAKAANHTLHLMKSAGTSFPGLVALKISKNFLSFLSKYCEKSIITITGTNGKTTTAGLFAHILKTADNSVLHNEKGANMLSGIASSLAVSYKPFSRFDYAVLEYDEAHLTKLSDYIKPQYLLVTNLFRDQLDRYGELDTTARKIQEAIDKNKDLRLFLNADDPMVANLGSEVENKIFFGFDNVEIVSNPLSSHAPAEVVNCPVCGEPLKYNSRFFAQQGHYYCNCGYQRPKCKYSADVKIYGEYSILTMKNDEEEYDFKIGLLGLYNAYNALAAIAVALEAGFD